MPFRTHHTVEVRHIGGSSDETMSQMRTWLDHNQIEVAEFKSSRGGPGITFRLVFVSEAEASAFAKAFRGRLTRGQLDGGALWRPPGGQKMA